MPPASSTSTINIDRVLKILWDREPISRVEIARILDLDKSTVSKMIHALVERGIARSLEQGETSPSGGRKPTFMGIDPGYGAILGVEIQTDSVRSVAVSLDGSVLFQVEQALPLSRSPVLEVFEEAVVRSRELLRDRGLKPIAAGLGVSGLVNPFQKSINQSMPLAVHEPIFLDESVERRFGIPVFVENDARCCCWGDLALQRGNPHLNFLYLLGEFRHQDLNDPAALGISVGFGFVINGQVHYGTSFAAGEFRSIFKEDRFLTQFSMPRKGETFTVDSPPETRRRVFRELARNLAFLFNMLNLQKIGIAGELTEYQSELRDAISREIQENWAYRDQSDIEIGFSGPWSVAYGAAALVLEHLFANPKVDPTHSLLSGIELFDRIECLGGK